MLPQLLLDPGVHPPTSASLVSTAVATSVTTTAIMEAGEDHLAAMRERMQAMAEMAELSNMQTRLAMNIKSSMERIDKIMEEDTTQAAENDEVAAWRKKIEELSRPTVASSCRPAVPIAIRDTADSGRALSETPPPPRAIKPMAPSCIQSMRASSQMEIPNAAKELPTDDIADGAAAATQPSLLRRCVGCFCQRSPSYSSVAPADDPESAYTI